MWLLELQYILLSLSLPLIQLHLTTFCYSNNTIIEGGLQKHLPKDVNIHNFTTIAPFSKCSTVSIATYLVPGIRVIETRVT